MCDGLARRRFVGVVALLLASFCQGELKIENRRMCVLGGFLDSEKAYVANLEFSMPITFETTLGHGLPSLIGNPQLFQS